MSFDVLILDQIQEENQMLKDEEEFSSGQPTNHEELLSPIETRSEKLEREQTYTEKENETLKDDECFSDHHDLQEVSTVSTVNELIIRIKPLV